MPVRPRHCIGQETRARCNHWLGRAGKVSDAVRSQETTFVRATFSEPRGRSWWRTDAFTGVRALRAFLVGPKECPFCFSDDSLRELLAARYWLRLRSPAPNPRRARLPK